MSLIFDDIIYSLQKVGGISELWMQISKGMPIGSTHIIYDSAKSNLAYKMLKGYDYLERSSKLLILKRYLDLIIHRDEKFIFHSSYFRLCASKNAINVVHVYDFIYERYRKDIKSIAHKIQKRRALNNCDGIICISECTKNDLLYFCPNIKGKIKVVHCGYDVDKYTFENRNLREKKVLFVGGRKEYKRFDLAVSLLRFLPQFQLVIVGGGELNEEELLLLQNIKNRFTKIGYVSKAELSGLYNNAYLLLYPSDYEGFGIPPIEAQACGCPVVCQQTSSLVEVVQDSGIVLDPNKLVSTVTEINRLLEGDNYLKLQQKGLENIKRFSWDKCRMEVVEFYNELLEIEEY